MKKKLLSLIAAVLAACQLAACTTTAANAGKKEEPAKLKHSDRAKIIYDNIKANYYNEKSNLYYETNLGKQGLDENKYAYNWPTGSVFQGIVEMRKSNITKDSKAIELMVDTAMKYYNNVLRPAPGYDSYVYELGGGQRFYDDNEWYGLTYIDAYNLDKKEEHLTKAKEVYDFIITGYDDKMGGGLYWRENDPETKNTCSNGPGIVLALKLYEITKDKKYLDFASELYEWTNKNLLSPQGVYWDHVKSNGLIEYTTWTYNTGIMIQANAMFYKVTGEEKYLKQAESLAQSSLAHFTPEGKFQDNYWFNAILLRGYEELYNINKNDKYINAFDKYAVFVWGEQRDKDNFIGTKDSKPLLDQGGMLEIYSVLSRLKDK